jgi:DNA-binding GntR family transcriptional regulator
VIPSHNGTSRPTANGTGAEFVHHQLREAILHGRLEAGAIMSQVQLAREFGVSRTPLREALRMLQREGLVEGEANRRVRVAPFSLADLEELYALRIVNEALGIRLTVPHMNSDDDAFLDRALEVMARSANERELDVWEGHHRAFHRRLVVHAGARQRRLLEELSDHSERYRRLYVTHDPRAWAAGSAEHEAIVAACHARDAPLASTRLARHLSRTALSVLTTVAPEHEPAAVRSALRSASGTDGSSPSSLA